MAPHRISNAEDETHDKDVLDPIAIVGYSSLLPGDAVDAPSFWKLMMERRVAMTNIPESRMSLSSWHHADRGRRGQFYPRGGCFLQDDVSCFDAPFFSLSADEASALDPQQRHLLEVTYRALENAGLPIEKVAGSRTSVYVGCFNYDYKYVRSRDPETTADYDSIGVSANMNADRLSWFFDLRGPSMIVDTACSSSLVALDLACQSLLNGDVNMGIVAGTNLILSPESMLYESNMSMLSPDSLSYSFDHRANGFSRGEGTVSLVIKRLSDAIRDGDTVRAVIRSTACNQNGRGVSSIMQPDVEAQAKLIHDTYAKAGLSMEPTRFFEAHGTGTSVGDPIEMNALGKAFQHVRDPDDPLIVGALKANIGHLEGASGLAAVIKVIMVLESGLIPPNANFEKINPKIDPELLGIQVPLSPTPWPTEGLRRASVNSFGLGGSNAHAVLDDALHFLEEHRLQAFHRTVDHPPTLRLETNGTNDVNGNVLNEHEASSANPSPPTLLSFSAFDDTSLKRLAMEYKRYFGGLNFHSQHEFKAYLADLAHTLNTKRSTLPARSHLLATKLDDLQNVELISSSVHQPLSRPVLAFAFTGQGAQWEGMGQELFSYPIFARRIQELDTYLKNYGSSWSLREVLLQNGSANIHSPQVAQPANTALQIALVDLLASIGLQPAAVFGHSSGEIAAAYACGSLSADEAIRVAYFRGVRAAELVRTSESAGGMIAVGLSEEDVRPYVDQVTLEHGFPGLQIACINSQRNTTVAGLASQVDSLAQILQSSKIFARKLAVPVAYHTSYLNNIASTYRSDIESLKNANSSFPPSNGCIMMSSVTGKLIATPDLRSPEYWVKNLVSPVQFARAFKQVCKMSGSKKLDGSHRSQLGVNILLEVGPHAALQAPIRDLLETIHWGRSVHYTAALRRNQPATNTFLDAVGLLNGLGCSVDLSRVNHLAEKWEKHETNRPIITDLPQYPFDHSTSYWRESRIGRRFRLGTQGKLDLLGKPVPDWNELESRWRNYIRVSEMPWVEDHVVDGTLIYPAAGMMAMAIEAANQMADHRHPVNGFELKNIRFMRALVVPRTADGVETNLHLQRLTDDGSVLAWAEFRLFSYTDNAWQENCRGSIKIDYESAPNEVEEENHEVDNFRQEDDRVIQICKHECVTQELYQRLRDSGFDMGPTFQTIQQATFSTDDVVARAKVKVFPWQASQHSQPHVVHPTTLDGLLQVTMAALTEGGKKGFPTAVPTNLRRLWVAKGGLAFPQNESVLAVGRAILHSRGYETEFFALNESRTALLLQAEGIQSTTIANRSKLADETDMSHSCLHLVHLPDVDLLNSKQLAAYCAAHAKPQGPEPVEYYREVDFVLYKFLHDTLAALDKEYAPERVQGYLQKYVAWGRLQREKFANGDLPLSQPQWVQLLSDEAYFKSVCERISSSNAQGYGFVRTGQNLLSILCGEQDALRFLFTQDMMPNFYQEFNRNRVGLDQWEVYLRILAHKNPGLKILEIGAGTGGSTARVLETLFPAGSKRPLYKSYDYTDISPAFFERAAEMYNRFTRINFRTLDIENDASVDEFELGSYDLVIAGSVLHATHIISHTMKNVQKLLKPGGKLMMYEPVRPDIVRSSFIGGLMEGWWSGADDNRIWNPAVTEDQWDAILRETGFSGIDLSLHDYENPDCWECSVILSTAVGLPSCSSNLGAREEETVCFIGDPASSMQRNIFEQGMTALASHLSQAAIIEMRRLEDCVPTKTTTLVFIAETEAPFLHNLKPDVFSKLQSAVSNCANMLWVSAGGGKYCRTPELSVVDGWTRTLRSEKSTRRVGTLALDLNGGEAVSSQQVSHLVKVLMGSILNEGIPIYEAEFVEVDGLLHIPRVIDNPALEDRIFATLQPPQPSIRSFREAGPVRLAIEQHGLLDTLHWTEDKQYNEQDQMQPDEVEVQVQAVGMNFKDCLIALGRMPGETFGQEFAGIVTRAGNNAHFRAGDRVAGGSTESFKTFVRTTANLTCRIPDNFTFAEAASVPTQFFTAWQVIYEIARLKKGESILIHAAAGGTGQASLQIAQSVGAEIYATVGSKAKKDILMTEYGIPADHIFYSRDVSFSRGIMRATKGRGVDVIINSLSGDLLRASWECIGAGGRFVEIGKRDILSNSNLPMAPFGNNATFTHFYASNMLRSNDWTLVTEALFKLFASGQLHIQRPLQVLSISDAEDAFRMMQSGSAAGKIVLQVESQAPVRTILQPKQCLCSLDAQATYVVVGGLGGLGRTIVRWMISRGARNLVLLGRSGATSTKALELLAELKAQHPDIHIETPPCDVVDMGALQHVLQIVTRFMPPIRGCVQAAMVLRDVMFSDMSYEDWHTSLDCKVRGSRNLAQTLPEDMDFFILLSSASGIVGSPGQSNYASGNTYLDGLARSLVAKGRRVISLDLGAMAEDGFLVESAGFLEKVLGYGTLSPVSRSQFYAVLDYYCDNTQPLLEPMTAQVAIGIPSNGGSRGRLADLLADQPLFRYLNICNGSEEDALANSSQKVEYKKQLARAESLQEGRAIVFQALVEKLTRACNLVPENVDTYRHVPIQKLGVDSLLAIEVCNWIGKEFSADVAVFELMGGETLSTVDVLVAQRSQIGHPSWTID